MGFALGIVANLTFLGSNRGRHLRTIRVLSSALITMRRSTLTHGPIKFTALRWSGLAHIKWAVWLWVDTSFVRQPGNNAGDVPELQ